MKINLLVKKFATMSYNGDDYDEQYEEYCRRYEEEEILYVDGGILKHEYDENYYQKWNNLVPFLMVSLYS